MFNICLCTYMRFLVFYRKIKKKEKKKKKKEKKKEKT